MLTKETMKFAISQASLHTFTLKVSYLSFIITLVAQFGDYFSSVYGLALKLTETDMVAANVGQLTDLFLRLGFSFGVLLPLYILARRKHSFLLDGFASILSIVMPMLTVGIVLNNLLLIWGV